jgi:hypothetical protein
MELISPGKKWGAPRNEGTFFTTLEFISPGNLQEQIYKKYPNDKRIRKMSYKVNHGGEVWHVLNICAFLIAIKLNEPN